MHTYLLQLSLKAGGLPHFSQSRGEKGALHSSNSIPWFNHRNLNATWYFIIHYEWKKRKDAIQPAREPTFSLINQAICGVYKCQKQFASLWYLTASGVLYEIGNCYRFHFARHRQNTFWLGNMCTRHFRTMYFYQNGTAAALILHSWRATPERMVILKKKRHLIYLYSLPTWINFSPENIGCCEHDLQFPRINVFVAVVSPVKLKYIAKSKQLWVQL